MIKVVADSIEELDFIEEIISLGVLNVDDNAMNDFERLGSGDTFKVDYVLRDEDRIVID